MANKITYDEAYKKVCDYLKERVIVASCRKYRTCYGFFVASQGTNVKEPFYSGRMICVNRSTGKVFTDDDDEFNLYGQPWISVQLKNMKR